MDRGAWQASYSPWDCKESDVTAWLTAQAPRKHIRTSPESDIISSQLHTALLLEKTIAGGNPCKGIFPGVGVSFFHGVTRGCRGKQSDLLLLTLTQKSIDGRITSKQILPID